MVDCQLPEAVQDDPEDRGIGSPDGHGRCQVSAPAVDPFTPILMDAPIALEETSRSEVP